MKSADGLLNPPFTTCGRPAGQPTSTVLADKGSTVPFLNFIVMPGPCFRHTAIPLMVRPGPIGSKNTVQSLFASSANGYDLTTAPSGSLTSAPSPPTANPPPTTC